MRDGFTRLTTDNATGLLATLRRLARDQRLVEVTQRNVVGGNDFAGSLTFRLTRGEGVQLLEARSELGMVMYTPVMPGDFVPRRNGDSVAYYRVIDNVVVITCEVLGEPSPTRIFAFS